MRHEIEPHGDSTSIVRITRVRIIETEAFGVLMC